MLARISLDKTQFLRVLNALVLLFLEDRSLLEVSRGRAHWPMYCMLHFSKYFTNHALLFSKYSICFLDPRSVGDTKAMCVAGQSQYLLIPRGDT